MGKKDITTTPQNERCDQLAVTAAKDMAIEQDIYYEQLKQKA